MGPIQQEDFEDIKKRLSTTPVLAYPNFELPFIITTDASSWQLQPCYTKYRMV